MQLQARSRALNTALVPCQKKLSGPRKADILILKNLLLDNKAQHNVTLYKWADKTKTYSGGGDSSVLLFVTK